MLFKLTARAIRNPFFLVVLTLFLSVSAQAETITINSLGGSDSCASGYQTSSDDRFCVANNMALAGTDLTISDNSPQTYKMIANGANLTSFTLSQMTINMASGSYELAGTGDDTGTYLRLFDSNDDEITTFSLSANRSVTTADMSMTSLFGTFSASPLVARLEFVIVRTNTGATLSDFQIKQFQIDTTAPVFEDSSPVISALSATGANLAVDLTEEGTVYYVVLADGANAPSAAEVKAETGNAGSSALDSGNFSTSGTTGNATLIGLSDGTAYDVYVVAEDSTPNLQASATQVDFSTTDTLPTVSSIAVSGTPAANAASIDYIVTFGDDVSSVTTNDFTAKIGNDSSGLAVTNVIGSGASYTVTVAASDVDGAVRLDLNSGSDIVDESGNLLPAYTNGATHSTDVIIPTVAITDDSTGIATGDVTYTFTFSEAVTGFTTNVISVTGGSKASSFATGVDGDSIYTLLVTPNSASSTDITLDVAANIASDDSGNNNTAAAQSVQTVDTIIPTVTITDDATGTATGDVTYTFTFSDAVFGFTVTDVTVIGGSKAISFASGADGDSIYTLVITPNSASSTDITMDVAAEIATDASGNNNTAAIQSVQTVDTLVPTVAITDNATGTATGDVTYTFTFSEAVFGFTVTDVTVIGGSKAGSFATGTDGDSIYTLVVTPNSASTADITLDVAADIATDAAGNNNTAAAQSVQAVDTVAPVIASAAYDASTGTLIITGRNFSAVTGASNDIYPTKLALKGEGNNSYTLTGSRVEISSATEFSVTLSETDKINVNGLFNKNGANADDNTPYNLAAADNFMANVTAGNTADDTTGVTVNSVTVPTITSATYDGTTGALLVTGANLRHLSGASNDVDLTKLTIEGQDGDTYTLTTTDVDISSATSFTTTLNATDKSNLAVLLNNNGSTAVDNTVYNLAAADDWMQGAAASTDISDARNNNIEVSNVLAPSITLTASLLNIDEAAGSSVLTATLSAATNADVIVNLAYTGVAINSSDYTGPSSITINAGQMTGTETLTATQDANVEAAETIVLDIDSVEGYASENGDQRQTLTITDDDSASVTLIASNSDIAEAAGSSTVTAILNQSTFENVTVSLGYSGTATSGSDYDSPATSITIIAGQTTGTTALTATADESVEAGETIIAEITDVSGGSASELGTQQQTVTITDDDTASVMLTVDNAVIGEEADGSIPNTSTITATLDKVTFEDVTVTLGYSGSAISGSDYVTPMGSITITAGQMTGSTTLTATADTYVEAGETIIIEIADVSGGSASESGAQLQTITITDNDSASVTLTVDNAAIAEAADSNIPNTSTPNTTTIRATLDKASFEDVTVALGYSGTASSADHSALATSIIITAGQTTGTATLTAIADTDIEADETIIIEIADVSGGSASESGTQQQTVTIINDDSASVTLSVNNAVMVESAGTSTPNSATITATLSQETFEDVTVTLGLTGSATSGSDYSALAINIIITAGQTTGMTTLTATADTDVEASETIILDITDVSGGSAKELGSQQQTITIFDDDSATVILTVDNAAIAETAGSSTPNTSTISATLGKVSFEDVTVTLDYSGSATSGSDYVTATDTITIIAGQTTGTATLTAIADTDVEAGETIMIDITDVSGGSASESGTQQQTVTLTDDDIATVTLSVNNATMLEAAGTSTPTTSTITATLDKASFEDVTVNLEYSGTAISGGTDYDSASSSITILAGDTYATAAMGITPVDDALFEGAETIIIDIASVNGDSAYENGTQQQRVTINDDDAAPTIAFNVSSSSASETIGSVNLQVDLSVVSGLAVTVDYIVTGTASGADHTLVNGTLPIAAGDVGNNITIASIVNDLLDENNETVIVTLSSPTNATLGSNRVYTYTINDDDAVKPSVVLTSNATPQSVTSFVLTATFSEAVTDFTVDDLSLSGGILSDFATADGGITYTATVTPTSASSVTFDVAANAAQDSTGNDNTAATQLSVALDNIAPTLSSSAPSNGSNDIAIAAPSIVLTFTEDVLAQRNGDNAISLILMSDSSVIEIETIAADSATIVGNLVTVNFTSRLIPNTHYGVSVGGHAFADTAANLYAGLSASSLGFSTANDAPTAADDSATVNEDDSVQIAVLANDSDTENFLLPSSTNVITKPSNGLTRVNTANGVITYTPSANFNGSDSFSYQVSDSQKGISNIATVNITVNPVNDLPVLGNDMQTTGEDILAVIDLLSNDIDIDADDSISNILIVSAPTNGSVTIVDGKVNYQPNSNFAGTDSFTYQAQDSTGAAGSAASVTVNVTGSNDLPVATNDSAITNEDSAVVIDVLVNDSDVESGIDPTTVNMITAPSKGSLSINRVNGEITYTPDANANGSDSFGYVVKDVDDGTSNEATVSITIIEINDAPVASDDTVVNVLEDITYPVNVLGNDTDIENAIDATTVTIASQPRQGSVSVNALTGVISYTPAANYFGDDSFTYTVNDDGTGGATGSEQSNAATVNLTIASVNDAPLANDDSYSVKEDSSDNNFSILTNDEDIDGSLDETRVTLVQGVTNGSLTVNKDGSVDYAPNANYVGSDSFIYTVKDNEGGSTNEATVTITVTNVNDTPSINSTGVTHVDQNASYQYHIAAIDIDNGDSLTITSSTPLPAWLTLTEHSDGSADLAGTPSNDAVGSHDINLTVTDDSGATDTQAFTITVTNVNDAPAIDIDNTLSTDEDGNQSLTFTYSDIDSDTVTASEKTAPKHGTLVITAGDIQYTPIANYNGGDSFVVTMTDGQGFSVDNTINVTVASTNDAPIAQDDQFDMVQTANNQYLLAVLDNDSDIDADQLTIIGASATLGAVSVSGDQLLYQAEQDFIGTVHLEYVVNDGQQGKDRADVSLTVSGVLAERAPEITLPSDVEVKANALYTKVDLGVATAVDGNGNALAVSLLDGLPLFRAGNNIAYWQATDANTGLSTTVSQQVLVHPLISLSQDQVKVEGNEVQVQVLLNGEAPSYPLEIAYSISGSSDSKDHNLVDGSVLIASGTQTMINATINSDSDIEGDETIIITLDGSLNLGNKAQHIITIREGNIEPEVQLSVEQNGENRLLLTPTDGEVTINAQVRDSNASDTVTVTWQLGEDFDDSIVLSQDDSQLIIDPSLLISGIYTVSLTATDNGAPALSKTEEVYLEVREQLATLADDLDSDGDMIPDSQEGYSDADSDGIPDYLDAIGECNVMPEQAATQTGFLVEGEPGICIRKGNTLAANETGGVQLTESDLANSIGHDSEAQNIGGIFDYIASGLPVAGQQYSIALPQRQPIPAGAIYRKYSEASGWSEFVQDDDNQLHSAAGTKGYCPPPGGDKWTTGLTEGHWCVQLTISDGGANDNDGIANNTIVDPGGVAVILTDNSMPVVNNDTASLLRNESITLDVLSNDSDDDGDSLSLSAASAIFADVEITTDNQLSYTPISGFVGTDTVSYSISDGQGGTASGIVTVSVLANSVPVAVDDSASTDDRTPLLIDVLANDSDPDNDALTLVSVSAAFGTVTITDNKLSYTPLTGANNLDTVSYTLSDGNGAQASATLTVDITAYQSVVADNKSKSGGAMSLWILLLTPLSIYRKKRGLVALIFLVNTISLPAKADWGVAVNYGQTKAVVSQGELNQQLSDLGAEAQVTSLDNTSMGWGVDAIYLFEEGPMTNWQLLLGYQNLGEFYTTISGQAIEPAQFQQLVAQVQPQSAYGWTVSASYQLMLTKRIFTRGRLGLFNWESESSSLLRSADYPSSNVDNSGLDLFYGLEIGHKLLHNMDISLSYQHYALDKNALESLGIGLKYYY